MPFRQKCRKSLREQCSCLSVDRQVIGLWHFAALNFDLFSTLGADQPTPAQIPEYQTHYSDRMSFWQRLSNFWTTLKMDAYRAGTSFVFDHFFIRPHLPDSPPISRLKGSLSAVFMNSINVLAYPRVVATETDFWPKHSKPNLHSQS